MREKGDMFGMLRRARGGGSTSEEGVVHEPLGTRHVDIQTERDQRGE